MQGSAATTTATRVATHAPATAPGPANGHRTGAGGPAPLPRTSHLPLHSARRLIAWACLIAAAVAVVAMAAVIHVAVADQDRTVTSVSQAVGGDDTAGIRAAQRVRSDLAEMDLAVTRELLAPTALAGTLPAAYNDRHRALVADLDAAAQGITLGPAETVPLANLQYERAQYQALVRDAILANQAGDRARALQLAGEAHDVMAGPRGLLDQAAALDKANTYALNQTYDRHKAGSRDSAQRLTLSANILLSALVLAMIACALCFRRAINPGLLAATAVATGLILFTNARITSSIDELTTARERALDPVHELAQARATVVAARQAEARWLLALGEPGQAPAATAAGEEFREATRQLFRQPDGDLPALIESARQGRAAVGSGGYLGRMLTATDPFPETREANRGALVRLGEYLAEHEQLVGSAGGVTTRSVPLERFLSGDDAGSGSFGRLVVAVDGSRQLTEEDFARSASGAAGSLRGVQLVNALAAAAMLVLVTAGVQRRLREYKP